VTQSSLPALNGNNGLVGPDDTHVQSVLQSVPDGEKRISNPQNMLKNPSSYSPDSVVNVDLPLSGRDASGLGVVYGVDTSVQVTLSGSELVSGDCDTRTIMFSDKKQKLERRRLHTTDDRALRSVLREQSSSGTTRIPQNMLATTGPVVFRNGTNSPGRQDNNSTGILFKRSSNTSQSQGLGSLGRSRSKLPQLVELGRVANGGFGEESGFCHHSDGFERVVSLGGFTGQHDTVGTVKNGVGNVGNFGSGRSGVILVS
jgi:hypothetical protein